MNYHQTTSLDLEEVSSTALEHLALIALKKHITEAEYQYLRAYQYRDVFESLITQGFFARLEMLIYELEYDEIDETAIAKLAMKAGTEFSMNVMAVADISNIMIPHIVLYPSYVQSYCTSRIVALQLYFEEVENNRGLDAYLDLLNRENPNLTFVEHLEAVGLESPFTEYTVRDLSDKIYFEMTGRHFFKQSNDMDAA
jgi:oligoendopeptidase F